jgi:hypothetical protein
MSSDTGRGKVQGKDLVELLKGVSKDLCRQRGKIQKEYNEYCEKLAQFITIVPYEKEDLHKILRGFKSRHRRLREKDQEIKKIGELILEIRGGKWKI